MAEWLPWYNWFRSEAAANVFPYDPKMPYLYHAVTSEALARAPWSELSGYKFVPARQRPQPVGGKIQQIDREAGDDQYLFTSPCFPPSPEVVPGTLVDTILAFEVDTLDVQGFRFHDLMGFYRHMSAYARTESRNTAEFRDLNKRVLKIATDSLTLRGEAASLAIDALHRLVNGSATLEKDADTFLQLMARSQEAFLKALGGLPDTSGYREARVWSMDQLGQEFLKKWSHQYGRLLRKFDRMAYSEFHLWPEALVASLVPANAA